MEIITKGRQAIIDLVDLVRLKAPDRPKNKSERFLKKAALAPYPEELPSGVITNDIRRPIDPANPENRAAAIIALALASRATINIGNLNDLDSAKVTRHSR